jgi:hypothetical protein
MDSCHSHIVIPPLSIQRACLTWKGWMMFPQSHFIQRRRLTQTVDIQVTDKLFRDVMLYKLMEGYQYIRGMYCPYPQG